MQITCWANSDRFEKCSLAHAQPKRNGPIERPTKLQHAATRTKPQHGQDGKMYKTK